MKGKIGDFVDDAATKACPTCGALMPVEALKCTKCDSFQGWYRQLNLSTTVLALLTALISVITAAAPTLVQLLRSGDSRVWVSYAHDDDQGGFFLSATNNGDRLGSLGRVVVEVPLGGDKFQFPGDLDRSSNPTIEPGKSQKIRYTLDVGRNLLSFSPSDFRGNCIIKVVVLEFSGPRNELIERDCKELRPIDLGDKL